MTATVVRRGRTYKQVRVSGITALYAPEVVDIALQAAGETRGSLFGIDVERTGPFTALVTLNTD